MKNNQINNQREREVPVSEHPTRQLLIAIITLNVALYIVRMAIAADLRDDFYGGSIESFLLESAIISALVGIAACWMAYIHIARWRQSTHDTTHALDILAFIFCVYSLAYAAKEIQLDNVSNSYRALAALSIIQAFTQLIQLLALYSLRDGIYFSRDGAYANGPADNNTVASNQAYQGQGQNAPYQANQNNQNTQYPQSSVQSSQYPPQSTVQSAQYPAQSSVQSSQYPAQSTVQTAAQRDQV